MEDLVHKDSLRGRYIYNKKTSTKIFAVSAAAISAAFIISYLVDGHTSEYLILHYLVKVIKFFCTVIIVIAVGFLCYGAALITANNISKIICPNCLKTVLLEQLIVICPFCQEKYAYDKENKNILKDALFDQCSCGGKIDAIKCYHCKDQINLFAPYNEKALERKRYE